jgi:hypothetical protein
LQTDGGSICDAPGRAIASSVARFVNADLRAGSTALAATVARQTVYGRVLIVDTYCPAKLGIGKYLLDAVLHSAGASRSSY